MAGRRSGRPQGAAPRSETSQPTEPVERSPVWVAARAARTKREQAADVQGMRDAAADVATRLPVPDPDQTVKLRRALYDGLQVEERDARKD